ncbi:InlB B-repeat-containing protein [Legionella quateirensis]|uniref:Transmembrane protein (Fibronectin III domain and Gp5 C-terminal repeat) n=1 Tax=Legionella quateirensis TaxID=45072 RepID=A0A378KVW5_9GAMM|nr:DUF1566 domain-containing protein [Legionella quateirensis]KTD47530.1 hypothetical protein Lqua_1923 [Legionella quateirensis]STY18715.1 transmembrane protein (fibronectin III domain and Gp5 C-terminal repeat) [Legionella quateirensis]
MQKTPGTFFTKVMAIFFFFFFLSSAQAAKPLWIFAPQTPTDITVYKGSNTKVIYTIHNQSTSPKNLVMKQIPGISQSQPCQLPLNGSCTLTLNINGSTLQGDVFGGPILCQQGNNLMCYGPSEKAQLHIRLTEQPPSPPPPPPPPPPAYYTVISLAGANGVIDPVVPQVVLSGSNLAFTAIPDTNFLVDQWVLDGNAVQNGGTSYQLNNIQANHTVEVTFTPVQYTVTPSAGANGDISPAVPQMVNYGSSITFTAIPNAYFAIDQWLLDGNVVQNGGTSYQLNTVQADHTIEVTFNQTTLSPLTSNLTLSINSPLPTSDPALSLTPRIIRIRNRGSITATNLQVSSTAFPSGSSITSNTCTGSLNSNATCDLTITPGATASPDATAISCNTSPGRTPVPTVVTVSADNATPIDINVLILGYGCIYQGGYLFTVDNTTSNTGSIGGKVAALLDEPFSYAWATLFDNTPANSLLDGLTNSNSLATPVGQYPAAQVCLNKADQGYTDWYLPAICELGRYIGINTNAGCSNFRPNLFATLSLKNLGGFVTSIYWSSSEYVLNAQFSAWAQYFGFGDQFFNSKTIGSSIRCIRAFVP